MALETWLVKVKSKLSKSLDSVRHHHHHHHSTVPPKHSGHVGFLAFEIAGLMSKLLHLWHSLSDKNIIRLRNDSIALEGVRKIVSNDDAFLLGLACAELAENLRIVANSVSRISRRCDDHNLRSFQRLFQEFADSGRDPHGWLLCSKEMEARTKKMDRYSTATATLYKEMDELSLLENGLRKALLHAHTAGDAAAIKEQKIIDLHQKIFWQRQEIKHLKDKSLWNRSFDSVTSMLVRSVFTVLARIKLVFGVGHSGGSYPMSLPRSLSAAVHPSDQTPNPYNNFVSGPLTMTNCSIEPKCPSINGSIDFFEANSKLLKAPETTLGAAALALHYANLIIVMEKMIKSPQLVGVDARDDLYSMLPVSVRSALRGRLKGVGFTASDAELAGEWKEALGKILGWLSPLAHNMIKWQSERSFEQQKSVPKTNVMLFQTLFFANREKAEAAITELLVGLNYIWRFEREMTAKALFQSSSFFTNGSSLFSLNNSSAHSHPQHSSSVQTAKVS